MTSTVNLNPDFCLVEFPYSEGVDFNHLERIASKEILNSLEKDLSDIKSICRTLHNRLWGRSHVQENQFGTDGYPISSDHLKEISQEQRSLLEKIKKREELTTNAVSLLRLIIERNEKSKEIKILQKESEMRDKQIELIKIEIDLINLRS